MAYGVIYPMSYAARNVESLVRSAVCASTVENGSIFSLLTKSATAGEGEVWTALVPASAGSHLTDLWMAFSPEDVQSGTRLYRGLDPDPRSFISPIAGMITAVSPQLHDLYMMSEDCFSGAKGVNTHVNATNVTWQLVWGASQTASVLSLKYVSTSWISIGSGAMDNQRLTSYVMEVVGL